MLPCAPPSLPSASHVGVGLRQTVRLPDSRTLTSRQGGGGMTGGRGGARLMDRGVNPVVGGGGGEIAPLLFTHTEAALSPCQSGKYPICLLLLIWWQDSRPLRGRDLPRPHITINDFPSASPLLPFMLFFPSLLRILYYPPLSSNGTCPHKVFCCWRWPCALIWSWVTVSRDENIPW